MLEHARQVQQPSISPSPPFPPPRNFETGHKPPRHGLDRVGGGHCTWRRRTRRPGAKEENQHVSAKFSPIAMQATD
eukprot:7603435-Karenia_brevis.AAC.1